MSFDLFRANRVNLSRQNIEDRYVMTMNRTLRG